MLIFKNDGLEGVNASIRSGMHPFGEFGEEFLSSGRAEIQPFFLLSTEITKPRSWHLSNQEMIITSSATQMNEFIASLFLKDILSPEYINTVMSGRVKSLTTANKMKFVILAAAVAAVTFAAPQYGVQQPGPTYTAPDPTYTALDPTLTTLPQASVVPEVVPIIKDERVQEDDGTFTVYVEAGNGITQVVSGAPSGPDGAVVLSGEYSYTAPDGNPVNVKFVADENGYQPQSDLLPVAPAFPHPIPQFVLDQIAFAAQEDAANAAAQEASALPAPSQTYIQPQ
ncbi:larval cuticle protein LCP-22 [Procambarus clarkii]|uniref:larval cuticle protein LCP-22 n=1 Tax=Procambarus clarkii TaxID=6728 RepID=UPI003742584F